MDRQTTDHLVMIRPAAFGYNAQTAENNTFQHQPEDDSDIGQQAQIEFDNLVTVLRKEGVMVTLLDDSLEPVKPDAVFPNNWISFHADGTIVTYPMYAPLRRLERNKAFINEIQQNFNVQHHIPFEENESKDQYLEGTGSLVLDRVNRIAYACLSQRTNERALHQWCEIMGYVPFAFHALLEGQPIYHTNVMMAIGDGIAVVGLDVVEVDKREALYKSLEKNGRAIVLLSDDQLAKFAGNMLAVRNVAGEQLMVMSTTARNSLEENQVQTIERNARIVTSDVRTIETIGGGSVRCMLAENFLPAK